MVDMRYKNCNTNNLKLHGQPDQMLYVRNHGCIKQMIIMLELHMEHMHLALYDILTQYNVLTNLAKVEKPLIKNTPINNLQTLTLMARCFLEIHKSLINMSKWYIEDDIFGLEKDSNMDGLCFLILYSRYFTKNTFNANLNATRLLVCQDKKSHIPSN